MNEEILKLAELEDNSQIIKAVASAGRNNCNIGSEETKKTDR